MSYSLHLPAHPSLDLLVVDRLSAVTRLLGKCSDTTIATQYSAYASADTSLFPSSTSHFSACFVHCSSCFPHNKQDSHILPRPLPTPHYGFLLLPNRSSPAAASSSQHVSHYETTSQPLHTSTTTAKSTTTPSQSSMPALATSLDDVPSSRTTCQTCLLLAPAQAHSPLLDKDQPHQLVTATLDTLPYSELRPCCKALTHTNSQTLQLTRHCHQIFALTISSYSPHTL